MRIRIDQEIAERIQTLAAKEGDTEPVLVNDLLEEALAARIAAAPLPASSDPIVAKYLKHNGARCPYCESENLDADGERGFDGPDAWCEIECLSCQGKWTDHYRLSNVSLDNGPDVEDEIADEDEDEDDEDDE